MQRRMTRSIEFQSTRPSRASTFQPTLTYSSGSNFNPQGPRGPRLTLSFVITYYHKYFNPQGPRGPRPVLPHLLDLWHLFQSTRPSRASTQVVKLLVLFLAISIHKALAGLDSHGPAPHPAPQNFNPQGPRGPRRIPLMPRPWPSDFNPQGPRGPRPLVLILHSAPCNFNPQGPRGPRLYVATIFPSFNEISIHKALAGLDLICWMYGQSQTRFQSTRPSRASTVNQPISSYNIKFQSTRPSRASTWGRHFFLHTHQFQSTRPSRASTVFGPVVMPTLLFQSTRPSRASTEKYDAIQEEIKISIHKALAGLDVYIIKMYKSTQKISIHKALAGLDLYEEPYPPAEEEFQSTRPSRASTLGYRIDDISYDDFNPQGPRGPRHYLMINLSNIFCISIHKALAGLDIMSDCCRYSTMQFQSTRPSRASTQTVH